MHLTSLPGPGGIGDLGDEAFRFAEFLASAGQTWWQMLPVAPPGLGDSPYATLSSFAGNPLLISLDRLAGEGFLRNDDLVPAPDVSEDQVRFGSVAQMKERALRKAFASFEARASARDRQRLEDYESANAWWLPDYALYRAAKDIHGGAAWTAWEPSLRDRRPDAIAQARATLARDIRYHEFVQYTFDRQWSQLREFCQSHRIGLIGDVPFFVAHDSADVWVHQNLFDIGPDGNPRAVAGVPPDPFNQDGQLWGFTLYRWDRQREDGYEWWKERFRTTFARFDAVRIDHFIGFTRVWAVPLGAKNAMHGQWVPGPGRDFFEKLFGALGPLELIAEDLGILTPEVEALRDGFDLPGIRVFQFGRLGDPGAEVHWPHKYPRRCVAATGTHDNDTSKGWIESFWDHQAREAVYRYLGSDGRDLPWDMIRAISGSLADTVIFPVQDVLSLGSEARMNRPGVPEGNWAWRLRAGKLTPSYADRLRSLASATGRLPRGG
jgi:4-alpha-glucanotransferase